MPLLCKTRVFRGWGKLLDTPAKTLQAKSFEKFLSIFCDWKSHSRESRELSRENLCVPLATGPSTHE